MNVQFMGIAMILGSMLTILKCRKIESNCKNNNSKKYKSVFELLGEVKNEVKNIE